jgi:hypothetical protein
MIPARNATDAHAQNVRGESLVATEFADYTLLETLDVCSLGVPIEQSVTSCNSSAVDPPIASNCRTAPDTPPEACGL